MARFRPADGPGRASEEGDVGSGVALPLLLVFALDEIGCAPPEFVDRVRGGSIWHDEELRSRDGRIGIVADLGADGLHCYVRIGEWTWAHFPACRLHCFHVVLPMTAMLLRDVPAAALFDEPLLQDPRIEVASLAPLNPRDPGMGTLVRLLMPLVPVIPG